jgi:hypothetical protein
MGAQISKIKCSRAQQGCQYDAKAMATMHRIYQLFFWFLHCIFQSNVLSRFCIRSQEKMDSSIAQKKKKGNSDVFQEIVLQWTVVDMNFILTEQ